MNDAVSTAGTMPSLQQITSSGVEQDEFHVQLGAGPVVDSVAALPTHRSETGAQTYIRALSQRLCEEHPAVSTYEGIFGGIPHLKGLRIAVADILEQLYLTGSISGVQRVYSPDVSEEQIKEAIAYAQDFIESAVSSSSEVNG
jgi:uncharacterized protein (DUF433 family)